jgi:hypothetical protein
MAAKTTEQPIAGRVRGWQVAVVDLARTHRASAATRRLPRFGST